MARFWNRLRDELLKMVPPFLFFLVTFHAIALTRSMTLEHYSIDGATAFTATFAALIVAKAVLLADLMPFINRFPDKPLIYNTLWKAGIYVFVAIKLGWILRPFIGDPELPLEYVRAEQWQENPYSTLVWTAAALAWEALGLQ